jgi:hypothetical protein
LRDWLINPKTEWRFNDDRTKGGDDDKDTQTFVPSSAIFHTANCEETYVARDWNSKAGNTPISIKDQLLRIITPI